VDAPETLEKLALVAIMCGALSVAYECFKKLQPLAHTREWQAPSANTALNCLHDFYKTWLAYKDVKLPKFSETFTAEMNNHAQYNFDAPTKGMMERWEANYLSSIPKYASMLEQYNQLVHDIPTHDVLFEKYGLRELAAAAKTERLRHEKFMKDTLARIKQKTT
ncbi:MAG: hypothetical protein JNM81_10155, partial [Rhodospirillaceae bacterium]|nr:hypothetical protein [Rhodospirillaceae bacterium]